VVVMVDVAPSTHTPPSHVASPLHAPSGPHGQPTLIGGHASVVVSSSVVLCDIDDVAGVVGSDEDIMVAAVLPSVSASLPESPHATNK
jgi:hypothetical protein